MTEEEKRAIVEEAKKHEPDIWSDEYFPYWEKVYAQFEESEDKAILLSAGLRSELKEEGQ